jgi:hypothetical protein
MSLRKLNFQRNSYLHLVIALSIGLLTAFFCYGIRQYFYPGGGDFTWALEIARKLLAGVDPYDFPVSDTRIPYPLPIFFFGIPFLWLPEPVAGATFLGLSASFLAFIILRYDKPWRLMVFLSISFILAMAFTQWSPLILASWFVPILAPTLALIKPQTAIPVALNKLTKKGVILAGVLLAITLIIYPTWPIRWLEMTVRYPSQSLIPIRTLPFGPFLLLAALFWKKPEGRLLLLSAFLPTRGAYDLMVLWVIPKTPAQMLFIFTIPWLVALVNPALGFNMVAIPAVVPVFSIPALLVLFWQALPDLKHWWNVRIAQRTS